MAGLDPSKFTPYSKEEIQTSVKKIYGESIPELPGKGSFYRKDAFNALREKIAQDRLAKSIEDSKPKVLDTENIPLPKKIVTNPSSALGRSSRIPARDKDLAKTMPFALPEEPMIEERFDENELKQYFSPNNSNGFYKLLNSFDRMTPLDRQREAQNIVHTAARLKQMVAGTGYEQNIAPILNYATPLLNEMLRQEQNVQNKLRMQEGALRLNAIRTNANPNVQKLIDQDKSINPYIDNILTRTE
jgi:hypothetical protein